MDEIYAKARQIKDKMEEARTLAGELASLADKLELRFGSEKREVRAADEDRPADAAKPDSDKPSAFRLCFPAAERTGALHHPEKEV